MSTDPALRKIVLFGNFGTGNLGNDATLQAILHNLRQYFPKAVFSCICTDPNPEWETMLQAPQGTVIRLQRLEVLMGSSGLCYLDFLRDLPVGLVDDGS
jgi:polysaccharide pyruvyl transferase WcaK-like protein